MTQQEKDEFNQRRRTQLQKDNKGRIRWAVIIPAIGLVLTVILGAVGKAKQGDIAATTVLDDMSVAEFIDDTNNGAAIYTGTATAVDPVTVKGEDGAYIMIRRKVEQEQKIYNEEEDKYEYEEETISDRSASCEEIEIDDAVVSYDDFHSLPREEEVYTEGADNNRMKTTYTYIPESVDGTFFIKVKDGEISSVEYYKSEDVSKESSAGFGLAIVLIWLTVIVIEIILIVKIVKMNKAIKAIQ